MDDSDPFFLDWGSSVNVNEDLRRSIQTEINSLDQEIRDLEQSISKEERISSQLRKDYSHAQAELINLRRGASDEKDNAAMNEQIQMRLGESLQKELVEVLVSTGPEEQQASHSSASAGHAAGAGGDHSNASTNDRNQKQVENESSCSNDGFQSILTDLPMKEYIEKRKSDVGIMKAKIYAKKALLDESRSNFAELQFQLTQTNERVVQEHKHQSAWNDDIEVIRKEHEAEKQRIKNIKDSLSSSRKNIGEWTQQDAVCMTSLSMSRESNSKEEAEWMSTLAECEAVVSELSRKVDHLSASIASKTNRINLLHDQFLQRESILEEQEIVRQETLKLNQEIDAHRHREMELIKQIAQARQRSETHEQELEKIKKQKSDIDLLRATNDDEEEALSSLHVELPRIVAMNDGLSREISSLQETIASVNQSNQSELLSIDCHLKDTSKQVVDKMQKVQEERKMLENNQSLLRELKQATLDEVEQHRNLKVNFDAAYDTQLKLIARKEMDLAKIRAERLEAKKLERLAEEISLEKLKCGVQIIQDADRVEKEYLEKIKNLQQQEVS